MIFADNEYDCVTFFEVIEHIEQPEKLLEQIKLSMKDNAVIIMSTPNREVFGDNIKNPFHCKEYSLQEFVDMIGKFFCIREVLGQRYKNPWIKKWNFMVSKYAMEFPLLLKIYSRHLSRKPKKYLEAGYFDKLELKNNYFSKETPENADYFILVCGKYGGIETTGRQE